MNRRRGDHTAREKLAYGLQEGEEGDETSPSRVHTQAFCCQDGCHLRFSLYSMRNEAR